MFPIIPYNLNHSSRTLTYSEVYHGNLKLPKVIASCDIPRDTVSEEICPENIVGKMENINSQIEVTLNDKKQLVLKSKKLVNSIHWIRAIRLADDCHNYNSRLCIQNQFENAPKFIIQIIKPIKAGQELILWFSEDILANLQMAFLVPANIQGQKKYVCNLCSKSFEYPNPLKLHLTLNCDKEQIYNLWNRLSKSVTQSTNLSLNSFRFQLKLTESEEKFSILNLSQTSNDGLPKSSYIPLNLSPVASKSSTTSNLDLQRPFSEPSVLHSSAFKPYPAKKQPQNNNSIRLTQSISNFTTLPQNFAINSSIQTAIPQTAVAANYPAIVDYSHAAQMETLVSNLGKSKQGHLCIYCGKCYSRKYGLKIHIRTHTGYKPLKCKFCLRPFGDPSNLNKHVRLHAEGDTPYKCDLCGKVLVRRRDLERHLRSRHMSDMHLGEQVEDSINSSSDHSDDT